MESFSSTPPVVPRARCASRRLHLRTWLALAVAAVSLSAAAALWCLRGELRSAPRAVVVAVHPAGTPIPVTRQRTVVRPPEGRRVILRLDLGLPGLTGGYAARVYPPGSRVPVAPGHLLPWGDALFLDLGPALRRGPYHIEIFETGGARPRALATYRLRIGQPEVDL